MGLLRILLFLTLYGVESVMKHKHYDMIVTKAANMDLVIFIKLDGKWEVGSHESQIINFGSHYEYFLCLPQHKEACLHWLNGGGVEVRNIAGVHQGWDKLPDYAEKPSWLPHADFMNERCEVRIKPKKEKRWIAVNPDGYILPIHADSKESIMTHASFDTSRLTPNVQFIEIEVEL
ncbi:conserved hypothetical protein [Vibrio phage 466E53-1]|nr:conserved hypothetical protein [Vibrio phage 466E53-1]